VNIAVPAGCAYQAQPGVYGGQSTLSVCCTDNPSSTADYTVVGGFSGSVPNKSNLPANDPTPLLSIGSPTYQLVSGNPYGSGGSQPTGQTFSDTTGSSLAATYIEPYVSQSVSWSGSITASYQSYTVYNYEYPNNPNLPYQPNPYLPNYNPYDYGSYPSYAPITLPKGGKITSSQNIQPTYTVPFTGQPSVNTIAPCVTMSCGNYSVTAGLAPDPLDPQMSFSINVGVANNYGATPPGSMSLHISPVNGGSYNYNGQQGTSYGAGYTTTSVFSNLGPTNSTGQYQYTWTLTGPNVSQTCGPQPFQVVDLPYLQVYGGDVMAGTSPSDNSSGVSSCAYDTNAGIYGWNGLGAYSYAGAGAQYAVQALAQIDGFASSQYSSNSPPTALSFSNAGTDPLSGLFGTNFSGTIGDCNFTRNITTQPLIGDQTLPGTLSNGITVPSTPIPDGQPGQIIVYVQGNVYINNNITYNLSGWSSPSDIPYFKLIVVAGNIYIGSNVTQLDGLYVTEPSTSGQGGTIYTCASANNAPITPTSAGYYGTCKNQLTINGAFVAAQVQFLRTYGTVGQSSTDNGTPSGSHAAEVFNYTPELWLPRSGANPNGDYSAITGLPPTL
jgi:hypothetical protein